MNPHAGKWLPAAVICLSILQAGCAAVLHPLPDPADRITEPVVLIEKILQRRQRINTVSTTGRIDSSSQAGPLRGRITTLVSDRRQVRFEAWTPTWDLVGSFIGDSETFIYFQRGQDQCLFGNSTVETINRVLPLGIEFEQYVTTLLGSAPIPDSAEWTIDFDRRCGCWLLTGNAPDGSRHLLRAEADGVVRGITTIVNGQTVIDVRFDEIRAIPNGDADERFPTTISFKLPPKKSRATLKFRDIEINGDTTDSDWDQVCPEGLDRVFIR